QVAHHVGLDVARQHRALRSRSGQAHREVAGARSDVDHRGVRWQVDEPQHLIGLLPGITRRIVEVLGPRFGIFEPMMTASMTMGMKIRRGSRLVLVESFAAGGRDGLGRRRLGRWGTRSLATREAEAREEQPFAHMHAASVQRKTVRGWRRLVPTVYASPSRTLSTGRHIESSAGLPTAARPRL